LSADVSKVNISIVQLGVFVRPAGAQLRSATDESAFANLWKEVGACIGYAKPDGWRFQIHKQGNVVTLFSRSGKNWTGEFHTVVEMIKTQVACEQVILDVEIVGFDQQGHHLSPSELRNASSYRCYLLDILYLHDKDLTNESTKERVALLWEYLHDACWGSLIFANYTPISSLEDLVDFYLDCQEKRHLGFDGAILKDLGMTYFKDVLKVKPSDTIDAVVAGAYFEGERVSKLLLVLPSPTEQGWKPIAIVAGFGSSWNAVWSACQPYVTTNRIRNLDFVAQKPDFWIIPKVVVAVQMTELQLGSKKYKVYAEGAKNCVLREDKGIDEATSFEQVYQIALSNERRKGSN